MKRRAYIGYGTGGVIDAIMTADDTQEANPGYFALWGLFPSLKCAKWVAGHCRGNPHMQTVSEAVRIYKHYKGVQ